MRILEGVKKLEFSTQDLHNKTATLFQNFKNIENIVNVLTSTALKFHDELQEQKNLNTKIIGLIVVLLNVTPGGIDMSYGRT